VAFSLILVRAKDGAVLWRYSFDQTQQSLTENLLNWRFYKEKGMRWVTARELAAYGMEEAIKELKEILS
jgi:arginase family enzyme